MPTEQTKQVPAAALMLECGPLQFADDGEMQNGNAPIRMLARTGQPVYHWYWGKVVHDLAGMQHKDRVPVDWNHSDYEIIGYLDQFDTSKNDLVVSGELVTFRDDDVANEIIHKGRSGVPYEASIDFRGGGNRIEELGEGVTAEVNGYTLEGPAIIFREWRLRGVAVCPHGVDPHASTEFSETADQIAVTLFSEKEVPMPEPKLTDAVQPENKPEQLTEKPAEQPETKPAEKPAELSEPKAEQPAEKPADPRAQFTTELKRFTERFGADGADWFADGKSYEEALELHAQKLETGFAAKDKELTDTKQKLASLDRGEDEPAEFNEAKPEADSKRTKEFQSRLGDGLGRFAAGIKLPQASRN